MLWELLFASIVGFLAVVPLAQHTSLDLPTTPQTWLISTAITGLLLVIMIGIRLWRGYGKSHTAPRFSLFFLLKTIGVNGGITLLTLLASSSYGLYQYHSYQQSLLTQPITVTAQISSHQISDNISQPLVTNITNAQEPLQIGTGYQRQIWQVDKILPFDKNANRFAQDKAENRADDEETLATPEQDSPDLLPKSLSLQVPLQVLVTADVNRNPDWQATLDKLAPKDTLTVKLALQPIAKPTDNFAENSTVQRLDMGFDESAWLRQRGVQATAQLLAIDKKAPQAEIQQGLLSNIRLSIERLRWGFRQKILTHLSQNSPLSSEKNLEKSPEKLNEQIHASSILLGLLTGDRGLMDSEIKHTYQITGISHLLAISGPHVMMLASFIAFLLVAMVKRFFPRLLLRIPARLLVLWVSVAVSAWYALLVGFELPAQRTVWMLLLVTLSVQWLLPLSAYRVLAGVGLLMLWLDTTAVMQAGFWLSFVAVGLLLKFSQAFQTNLEMESFSGLNFIQANDSQTNEKQANDKQALEPSFLTRQTSNLWHAFKQLLWLQLWLFVLMMPVVIWFFGKISFLSIVVNLVAVPLLGLVVVPLDMLAGLLSFLPVVGTWLSHTIWQGLSWALITFHHGLEWLINSGFAKQGYISIRPSQLILLALVIGLLLSPKGLLPRLLALPLGLATLAISYFAHADVATNPQNGAKLVVLDNTKLSISLWQKGDTAWLILANNRFPASEKPENKTDKKPKIVAKPINPNDILEQSIYPLLAKQGVKKLKGVVSQTPSPTVNAVVQNLSKEVAIEAYWLAGFDPIIPNAEFTAQGYDFSHVTPKPCQAGQTSDNVTAITGWRLNSSQLAEPLTPKESSNTQTCFIQIEGKQSALIMAGDSQTPSQMSEQLCTVKPVSLVVAPYNTPLTSTWLTTTQAKKLHIITGKYANQQLLEDSQYAIADRTSSENGKPSNLEIYQSGEQGNLVYLLE